MAIAILAALTAGIVSAAALASAASAAALEAGAHKGARHPASHGRQPAVHARVLVVRGAGFGHGVGMSQYGAAGFALHGRDYRFILAHYYQGTSIGTVSPNLTVRVLLGSSGHPSFTGADTVLSGTSGGAGSGTSGGAGSGTSGGAGSGTSGGAGSGTSGGTPAVVRHLRPSITYTVLSTPGGLLRLSYRQGRRRQFIGPLASPLVVDGEGPLRLVGRGLYDGSLSFSATGHGGVQTVEKVGLEDYVRGVVAEEMPASWPMQALEAQAVAARTYAITTDVSGQDFDVYDDTRSQVYGGVDAQTPATDAAVAATADQVVTYDGVPVVTYFFASSGGHTESVQNAFPGSAPEPWLVGVDDPYDAAEHDPYHRWTVQIPLARAQRELSPYLRGDGSLRAIRVLRRGSSPRIVSALVVGTRGSRRVSGPQLQSALGLLSTWAHFSVVAARGTDARSSARRRSRARTAAAAAALRAMLPRSDSLLAQRPPFAQLQAPQAW